ncbi:MAG: hypothetical protein ACRDRK_25360 [Pseudonocardia sp.]
MRLTDDRPAPAHAADRPTGHRVEPRVQRRTVRIEGAGLAFRRARLMG